MNQTIPEKIMVEIGPVQETLFLPLWGRAVESQKEHPRLVDPKAVEIMAKVDYDFSFIEKNKSNMLSQSAWITRSMYFDRWIKYYLGRYPEATVVNLGCGLDTTFDRVDNGVVTWYDLDLPDVMDLRRHFIAESTRRKFIAASILDSGWLDEIKINEHTLFMIAGVLYYFEEKDVKRLFLRLADYFPGCEVIFDASSPLGVSITNRQAIAKNGLREGSALKWGLKDARGILAWDQHFRLLEETGFFGRGYQPSRLTDKIMGWFSDLLKFSYLVRLEL